MTLDNLFTLAMLVLLQAVLGFDNLLYISIESRRVAPDKQQMVRWLGIGLAIFLRIALLFAVLAAIEKLNASFFQWPPGLDEGARAAHEGWLAVELNVHATIVLAGGAFIIYTAFREIHHMLSLDEIHHEHGRGPRSVAITVTWIVLMNLVFSFDSILSAIALTKVEWVMVTAIVLSGVMMIALADRVSEFLKKNRMYEVLGLFILLIVGVMLVTEGGHLAHLELFGNEVKQMNKTTFYFVIGVLVAVDVVQSRYQKKLRVVRERELGAAT